MIDRLDRMYDDFEWVVPGHPDGAVRRGRHAVTEFFGVPARMVLYRDPDKARRAAGRIS